MVHVVGGDTNNGAGNYQLLTGLWPDEKENIELMPHIGHKFYVHSTQFFFGIFLVKIMVGIF